MSYQVFLVDDDERVLKAIATVLRLLDYDVLEYHDEWDFLADLTPETSGCAVIDYRLARADGLEIIRELRARKARVVPILISGHADEEVLERAVAMGVAAFLQKPFENDDLTRAIDQSFEYLGACSS